LQAEHFALAIFDGGELRILRHGDGFETFGKLREFIAMGIPDLERFRKVRKQRAKTIGDAQRPFAVFAFFAFLDFAAEEMAEELQAETHAEQGQAHVENRSVGQRRFFRIHAGRSAGENDAARSQRGDFGRGRVIAEDDGIHVALANAARDDLRVLRTEIENNNCFDHVIIQNRNESFALRAAVWREKSGGWPF
jgi:hypothetical protein